MAYHCYLPPLPQRESAPRQLRFSLRSLMVAVALIAVVTPSLTDYLTTRSLVKEQLRIAAEFEQFGGVCFFEVSGHVHSLGFDKPAPRRPTNSDLGNLRRLTSLESLDLSASAIDDDFLTELRGLPRLQILHVPVSRVSIEAVAKLKEACPGLAVFPEPMWTHQQLVEVRQQVKRGDFFITQRRPSNRLAGSQAAILLRGRSITDARFRELRPLLERVRHVEFDDAAITLATVESLVSQPETTQIDLSHTLQTAGSTSKVELAIRAMLRRHGRDGDIHFLIDRRYFW